MLSTEKIWLNTPFVKRNTSIFLLITAVILILLNIFDYSTKVNNYLISFSVFHIISDIFNSRIKIITTEEKLEVVSFLNRKGFNWQEVCDYKISPSTITLYSDRKSVEINITFLQEKEQFIELITNELIIKIETEEFETECLSCGEIIIAGQDHCQKCNWSWQVGTRKILELK